MPGPFGLADRDQTVAMLTDAGYRDIDLAPRDEPLFLGPDADAAWEFVRSTFADGKQLHGQRSSVVA